MEIEGGERLGSNLDLSRSLLTQNSPNTTKTKTKTKTRTKTKTKTKTTKFVESFDGKEANTNWNLNSKNLKKILWRLWWKWFLESDWNRFCLPNNVHTKGVLSVAIQAAQRCKCHYNEIYIRGFQNIRSSFVVCRFLQLTVYSIQ